MEGEEKKDPILQYLQKYYGGGPGTEHLDSSTARNKTHQSCPSTIIRQYFRMLETFLGTKETSLVAVSRCGHSMILWSNIIRFMRGSTPYR